MLGRRRQPHHRDRRCGRHRYHRRAVQTGGMTMKKQILAAAVLAALAMGSAGAQAQSKPAPGKFSDGVVRIGLLLDMASLYADITGEGSVTAARMAVEDFGGRVHGVPVEVI